MNRGRVALCMLVLWSAIAQAHGNLKWSDPAAGAIIEPGPERELRLQFTQDLEPSLVRVGVTRDNVEVVPIGPATLSSDGRTVLLTVRPLSRGSYVVEWSVVSKDTHRTTGRYRFRVKGAE